MVILFSELSFITLTDLLVAANIDMSYKHEHQEHTHKDTKHHTSSLDMWVDSYRSDNLCSDLFEVANMQEHKVVVDN